MLEYAVYKITILRRGQSSAADSVHPASQSSTRLLLSRVINVCTGMVQLQH